MDINEAKSLVIKAGINLVNSGLIARTWGNVSCRVDEDSFVITPSGRSYNSLTPSDIVKVNIKDLSYEGDIKPSSEKGIHAEVYKLYKNINFVIHTHQENASVIAASAINSMYVKSSEKRLNGEVFSAKYALPGTKSLKKNVYETLKVSKTNAVIMKYHGALCFGKDYDETFRVAEELEKACSDYIKRYYLNYAKRDNYDVNEMCNFAFSRNGEENFIEYDNKSKKYLNCKRTQSGFKLYGENTEINEESASLYKEAETYDFILKEHKDINHIIFINSPFILAVSNNLHKVVPILDDFAQIAGTHVKVTDNDKVAISKALKKSPVVFIKGIGALCTGKTYDDAEAVSMVTSKAGKAYVGASLFGKIEPISHVESMLMRFVYVNKYSKKASNK